MRESIKSKLRPWVSPAIGWVRRNVYDLRYRRGLRRFRERFGDRVEALARIEYSESDDAIWERLRGGAPANLAFRTVSLARRSGRAYWERHRGLYRTVGNGREKALEHALTFELLDFTRIRRYCDVASSASPIEAAFRVEFPSVEYWKQDLVYSTDLSKRVIGGFAQEMRGVSDGYFDALALHCSFEHFSGRADSQFVAEVDRVLGPAGACLILPLYLDGVHRIYLDPATLSPEAATAYDPEARLCLLEDYRQEHGRYYSPEALLGRVISKLPPTLVATVLRFTDPQAVGPGIYLRFGLALHREKSVLTLD